MAWSDTVKELRLNNYFVVVYSNKIFLFLDIVGKKDTAFLIYDHYNFVKIALGSIETRVEMLQGCGTGGINKVDSEHFLYFCN